ncbi:YciI family protein [Rhodoligotrophos defluvii]|uniref:YciI family protein n=1 Tax=Rhodoligotrophos defluvii TaxID=2561934 RepID=UPI0010CA1044|nr:YciI family protein [Rhodoligotrophos defluvii]
MPFQIFCLDDPHKPGLRSQIRARHLRYMIAHRDRILFGGPMKAEDGITSIGSAFVLDYDSRAEVDRFLAEEPYMQAGLFSAVQIHPLVVMVPEQNAGFLEEELKRELAAARSQTVQHSPRPNR